MMDQVQRDPDVEQEPPLTDEDYTYFESLLQRRRRAAVVEIEVMQRRVVALLDSHLCQKRRHAVLAAAPVDAPECEQLLYMITRQRAHLAQLDRALEQIRNRTYGICVITGRRIARRRLEAVPYTSTCAEVRRQNT